MVPAEGFEPPTNGLQNRCSTPELSRPADVAAEMGVPSARNIRLDGRYPFETRRVKPRRPQDAMTHRALQIERRDAYVVRVRSDRTSALTENLAIP